MFFQMFMDTYKSDKWFYYQDIKLVIAEICEIKQKTFSKIWL